MWRHGGAIALSVILGVLQTNAKADIDPAEYELKKSLRSDQERNRLRRELARDQEREAEARRTELGHEARRLALEQAAWESLPRPVRLTRTRCTACHGAENFEQQRHNRIGWELVVLRMQALNDARLESGERALIAGYLATAFPATGAAAVREALEQLAVVLLPMALLLGWLRYRSRSGGPRT